MTEQQTEIQAVLWQWKSVEEHLTEAIEKLSFNPRREPTPKTKLKLAAKSLEKVQAAFQDMKITKLSRHAVRSEIAFAHNVVLGVLEGKKSKSISTSQIESVLKTAVDKLTTISSEVSVKAQQEIEHNRIVEINNGRIKTKQEALARLEIEEARIRERNSAILDVDTRNEITAASGSFKGMKQAMQQLKTDMDAEEKRREAANKELDHLFKIQRKKERIEKEPVVQDEDLAAAPNSEVRDVAVLEQMMKEVKPFKIKMKAQLKPLDRGIDYALVRGPIGLITNPQIQMQKLDSSNIKYKAVPFPGIKFGANPGGRREFIPHMFVLFDQLLVAFPNDSDVVTGPPSKTKKPSKVKKLAGKKSGKAPEASHLTREEVCEIINQRTGKNYIDVLGTSNNDNIKWIVNKQFLGVKFMWLLRRELYQRIGPLSIEQISLPF